MCIHWSLSSLQCNLSMNGVMQGKTTLYQALIILNLFFSLWKNPYQGWYKCNIDAWIFASERKYGIGICIREDQWNCIATKTFHFSGILEPIGAKTCGLLHVLLLAKDLSLSNMTFEIDCKNIMEEVATNSTRISYFYLILSKCRDLLSTFPNSLVSFIGRQANIVAHSLARASISMLASNVIIFQILLFHIS